MTERERREPEGQNSESEKTETWVKEEMAQTGIKERQRSRRERGGVGG